MNVVQLDDNNWNGKLTIAKMFSSSRLRIFSSSAFDQVDVSHAIKLTSSCRWLKQANYTNIGNDYSRQATRDMWLRLSHSEEVTGDCE